MKTYGLIAADNGTDMYISGTYDTRWDNDVLNPGVRFTDGLRLRGRATRMAPARARTHARDPALNADGLLQPEHRRVDAVNLHLHEFVDRNVVIAGGGQLADESRGDAVDAH